MTLAGGDDGIHAAQRLDAREILDAAIASVDGERVVDEHLELCADRNGVDSILRVADSSIALPPGRLFVVGAGKVAAPMALAVERLLGPRIADGMVITNDGSGLPLQYLKVCEASHPVPDARGQAATAALMRMVQAADEDDLVLCLLSGGASALMVQPAVGIELEQLQLTTELLLASGAPIDSVNAIRKHLSAVKGGGLAAAACPAAVVTLMLSDVVGNEQTAIGSGPTVPDPASFADCMRVVERYRLGQRLPAAVLRRLRLGASGEIAETPTMESPVFDRAIQLVVGDNSRALAAAAAKATALGYRAFVLTTTLQGEARTVGRRLAAMGSSCTATVGSPICLLAGGESTVTLRGKGRGGRNQEVALAAAIQLDGSDAVTVAAVGTDGADGPTDAAGAFADGTTVERGRARGLNADDFLLDNDSYTFFGALGDLVRTGPTRTNVMDLQIVLVGASVHG